MTTFWRSLATDLALVLVRRVVVRRLGGELGGARVDRLVGRDARRPPRGPARTSASSTPHRCASWASAKPSRLARRQAAAGHRRRAGRPPSACRSSTIIAASGRGTTGRSWHAAWIASMRDAAAQQLADLEEADRAWRSPIAASSSSSAMRVELRLGRVAVEPEPALLERAQRLLQALGERAPDRHRLADRLHLRAEDAASCRAASRTPSAGSW